MREYNIIKPELWKYNCKIQTKEGSKLGEIQWKKPHSYCVDLIGRTSQCMIKMNGWSGKMTLTDRRGIEIGWVKTNMWKGTTTFEYKHKKYTFKHYHWASYIFIWEDQNGRKLVSFKSNHKSKGQVGTVRTYGRMDTEVEDILINLGWYFMLIAQMSMG